jgi:hypothetical protein
MFTGPCIILIVEYRYTKLMSIALLFHYLMLNMFRMLVHPFSGACDLFVELYMCCIALIRYVLVLRCGSAGVVWYPYAGFSHEITQQINRKLLRMDVLTFKTCWALNNEIIKQVKSSWSIFIHLLIYMHSTEMEWNHGLFGATFNLISVLQLKGLKMGVIVSQSCSLLSRLQQSVSGNTLPSGISSLKS